MNDDQVMNFYLIFGLTFLFLAMGIMIGTSAYFGAFFIFGVLFVCFGLRILKIPTVLDIRKYIIEVKADNAASRKRNLKPKTDAKKDDSDCEEEIIDE